ncbi:MAG: radical SAM protein [Desulfarculaceae bacterium]|nr:radical SAM protein [Desulfarculaceae bacterium]MCF8073097.1 radical SAM protein [Desulfarculaceae bacterium]MCF8101818.1 radical SAM protein [Desulfarculaceae bacterium]MCF8115345.1 radical SAM protein [Desulfarculaceae bacterium]
MFYQGPIYRPPSEADSLLVQATVGCPHNKCSFCCTYKRGPRFRVRPVNEIIADLREAHAELGNRVRTLFLPAGDSLAMPTAELAEVCAQARKLWPSLARITVYAGVNSILAHGPEGLSALREAGLSRLHLGLESGHDPTLLRVKKGVTSREQARAGRMALAAGLELSLYVILGLAGPEDSLAHAEATAQVIDRINQAGEPTLRLRTLLPKRRTLLLHQIDKGRFTLCTPHQVLAEADRLIAGLGGPLSLHSDHYTNYVNLSGRLPVDRARLRDEIARALTLPRGAFRPDFVGDQ